IIDTYSGCQFNADSDIFCPPGRECQKTDWKDHENECGTPKGSTANSNLGAGPKWYDKYRRGDGRGNMHEGDLELITWKSKKEGTAWGGVPLDQCAALKRRFETEMRGDQETLFKLWEFRLRWTCCGASGGLDSPGAARTTGRANGLVTVISAGRECQKANWKDHKNDCGKPEGSTLNSNFGAGPKWYDKYRKCRDGNKHEGDLELITWRSKKDGTGWGATIAKETDDLRRRFETEMGGDQEALYKKWSDAFRWTCCGTSGTVDYGCDHHGSGSRPCSCDFCRMGKPLPDSIYYKKSAERMGLRLLRGPDPRSYHPVLAAAALKGRTAFGLAT
ncbi:hypothetical protein H0H92_005078, partial [Tricholoma furcatifolium]